jgi:hypothetical protein
MSGRPDGEGPDRVGRFQILWSGFSLRRPAADENLKRTLGYLLTTAQHTVAPTGQTEFAVTRNDAGYLVTENGFSIGSLPTAGQVLDLVYRRAYQRAFAAASDQGWVRLHCAVADGRDSRALLVAPSGTGKTTLACQLLLDGLLITADESAVVRDGIAIPVARRFHVKPGTPPLVSQINDLLDGPFDDGNATYSLDPGRAGFPWRLTRRTVDHVVWLQRPGAQGLTPASAIATMPRLVEEVFPGGETTSAQLGEIAALLRHAHCWTLGLDSLTDAATSISELVGSPLAVK